MSVSCLTCKASFNLWQCENCQLAFYCSECLVNLVLEKKAQCPSCQGIDWKMIRETFPSISIHKEGLVEFYCRQCHKITIQDKSTDSAKEKLCPTCFLYWYFKGALN